MSQSNWDGSVQTVKDHLRETVTDSDPLQFATWETLIEIKSGSYAVRCKYRAKNSFGGYVQKNEMFVFTWDFSEKNEK